VDHLAVVWCKQLVFALADAVIAARQSTASNISTVCERMRSAACSPDLLQSLPMNPPGRATLPASAIVEEQQRARQLESTTQWVLAAELGSWVGRFGACLAAAGTAVAIGLIASIQPAGGREPTEATVSGTVTGTGTVSGHGYGAETIARAAVTVLVLLGWRWVALAVVHQHLHDGLAIPELDVAKASAASKAESDSAVLAAVLPWVPVERVAATAMWLAVRVVGITDGFTLFEAEGALRAALALAVSVGLAAGVVDLARLAGSVACSCCLVKSSKPQSGLARARHAMAAVAVASLTAWLDFYAAVFTRDLWAAWLDGAMLIALLGGIAMLLLHASSEKADERFSSFAKPLRIVAVVALVCAGRSLWVMKLLLLFGVWGAVIALSSASADSTRQAPPPAVRTPSRPSLPRSSTDDSASVEPGTLTRRRRA
jgi:hypothetical protein